LEGRFNGRFFRYQKGLTEGRVLEDAAVIAWKRLRVDRADEYAEQLGQ
jgi:hypothetical protein